MAYRLRYHVWVDWVGAGEGPMGGATSVLPGSESGGAQTLKFVNTAGGQNLVGSTTFTQANGVTVSGALAAADVVTLLNGTGAATGGMCLDLNNQISAAATLARLQSFVAGGQ